MTMITPSYLGETIEYSSLHACRSTLEDPTLPLCTGTITEIGSRRPACTSRSLGVISGSRFGIAGIKRLPCTPLPLLIGAGVAVTLQASH